MTRLELPNGGIRSDGRVEAGGRIYDAEPPRRMPWAPMPGWRRPFPRMVESECVVRIGSATYLQTTDWSDPDHPVVKLLHPWPQPPRSAWPEEGC